MRQPNSSENQKHPKHRRGEEKPVYWGAALVAAALLLGGIVYALQHTL